MRMLHGLMASAALVAMPVTAFAQDTAQEQDEEQADVATDDGTTYGDTILVTATRKGKKLVLEVTDTGPGLHIGQTRPKLSTGVGLANIRDRLAQAYGAQQSFETRSIPGGGFSVTLELPFTRNANQEA